MNSKNKVSDCELYKNKVIATATRCGSLHFLDCQSNEQANATETKKECRDVEPILLVMLRCR